MTTQSERPGPRFDELPILEPLGLRHAWGAFGADDELGTVNHMTPETVASAAHGVREGKVFRLDLPLDLPDPPLFGRTPYLHTFETRSRNTWDDRLDSFHPQGSTNWDALRHVRCREFGFYGGVTDDPAAHERLGIDAWARTGIVGRGVLVDVARYLEHAGDRIDPASARAITVSELDAALGAQGVTLEPGDILCVRTGWMTAYLARRRGPSPLPTHSFVGLSADESMARYLWDARIVAVAADNPGLEVAPGDRAVGSLHRRLIPMLGFAVGELFALDELAERCVANRRWTFLFVSIPLYLPGGVGSPANALAIV